MLYRSREPRVVNTGKVKIEARIGNDFKLAFRDVTSNKKVARFDMYSDITLGKVFFVKHASVQIGSYVYDEPGNANDPRLVSYGDVPTIAFSEAMGDLVKIAGKSEGQQPEATDV